jgi:hypothetical protein
MKPLRFAISFRLGQIASTLFTCGLITCGLIAAATASASVVYDAVNDFSLASNPNGAWAYGTLSNVGPGATFSTLPIPLANVNFVGSRVWTNGLGIPNGAAVEANASGVTQSYATIVLQPNQLRLDGENFIDDVRWTAPSAGTVNINGLFQGIDTRQSTVSVVVEQNGVSIYGAGISAFGDTRPFGLTNVSVSAGNVIDFVEAPQVFFDDSTGLKATLTFTPVPEPATLVLAALGVVFFLGARCRPTLAR